MADPVASQSARWLADFTTVFGFMWYRDFPIQTSFRKGAGRADWTTHLGITVRSTADLLGLFTHFEDGGRTDAVLRDNTGSAVMAVEWEYEFLHRRQVNELEKLLERCRRDEFKKMRCACLIGYARLNTIPDVFDEITVKWTGSTVPLLLIAIHSHWSTTNADAPRRFEHMTMHRVQAGERELIREQAPYPWAVKGSRWERGGNEV